MYLIFYELLINTCTRVLVIVAQIQQQHVKDCIADCDTMPSRH